MVAKVTGPRSSSLICGWPELSTSPLQPNHMPPVSLSASYTPTARPPAAGPPSEIGATRFETIISRLMKRCPRCNTLLSRYVVRVVCVAARAMRASCATRGRDHCREPVEQRGHRLHARLRRRLARADLDRQSVAFVDDREAFFVGKIVAGKKRLASDKRRLVEERTQRAAFVHIL